MHQTFQGGTSPTGPTTPVDCRVAPGCLISVGQSNPSVSAVQLISFGTFAPSPSITVSQSIGLTDGQSVTVSGTGYTPSGDNVWIGECVFRTDPSVCDHESAHQVFELVDANGGFTRTITVHETFQGATDANPGVPIPVDCRVAPGCVISGGQSNPNISAIQPISFD